MFLVGRYWLFVLTLQVFCKQSLLLLQLKYML